MAPSVTKSGPEGRASRRAGTNQGGANYACARRAAPHTEEFAALQCQIKNAHFHGLNKIISSCHSES